MESLETRRTRSAGNRSKSASRTTGVSRSKTATRFKVSAKSKTRTKPAARKAPSRSGISSRPASKPGASKTTTDHEEIQKWAEARSGVPSTVKGTGTRNQAGVLRIDFPGFSGAGRLKEIDWEEWFDKFDQNKLQFLYQDKTKDGKQSRFFKLVKRK